MSRSILHLIAAAGAAAAGLFIFSYKIFPLVLGASVKPVAPLMGMAAGLAFIGIAGLAGLGFWLIVDLLRREFTLQQMPKDRLLDRLAGTQYLTAALLLVVLHYAVK